MATIIIENEVSRIFEVPADIQAELQYELSYPVNGFQFTRLYKEGRWNGRKKLFWYGKLFPTGLANLVCTVLSKHQIPFTIQDRRRIPERGPGLEFRGEDRDYQHIEDRCIEATRGIIEYATGSGKTACAARIIAKLDVPTLYIVPTKELLHQTAEELGQRLDISIGKIGDGLFEREFVTVATVQTIHRTLKKQDDVRRPELLDILNTTDLLFMDEAHHLGAKTYYDVATAVKAYYKFGMTGTAFREDGANILLRAATGRIVAKIGSSELIRNGVLSKTTVRMYDFHDRGNFGYEWSQVYDNGIVYNHRRNVMVRDIVSEHLDAGRKVLVIVKLLEHGRRLREWIGRGTVFVHGSVDTERRKEIRREFRNGDIRCLIATKIYDEGVDLPDMDVLVLAGGGKSQVQALQRVGRALRKAPGKDRAIIVDFMDTHHRMLRAHSERRLHMYNAEPEFEIERGEYGKIDGDAAGTVRE